MSLFKQKKSRVGNYTEKDYEEALTDLDEEVDDDFFGKKSFTESASTVMAIIKAIIYIAFIVVISGALAYFAISFVNDVFAFVKEDAEYTVTIPEYVTSSELAEILGDAGVIKHPGLFRLYGKLKKVDKKETTYNFVAGEYTVNSNMNYDELFLSFVEKHIISTIRLTIPEGYTVDDIIKLFLDNGIGTRDGWIDAVNNYDFGDDFPYLKEIDMSDGRIYRLEGYLFPDTYDFYTGMEEPYYLRKLLVRFDEIMNEKYRARCEELGVTMDEVIKVASIIEKEAYYANDYEIVSQVIWNRLAAPDAFPRLECDSTIIYIMSHDRGTRVTELSTQDLSYDSPYNSYTHIGLPPGPICNPSYNALVTALYPSESQEKYYYFVTDADNMVRAATTLKEHNQNIEDIKREKEQAR